MSKMHIDTYYTDYWKAYENILPSNKHIQSKAETYRKVLKIHFFQFWFRKIAELILRLSQITYIFFLYPACDELALSGFIFHTVKTFLFF